MSAHNFTITRSSNRKHLIAVIDGPNMSSLGKRSKKVYGNIQSLDELKECVRNFGEQLGVEVKIFRPTTWAIFWNTSTSPLIG